MIEGKLVKCADDPWCGKYFKAHKNSNGKWVRFLRGHHIVTKEQLENVRKLHKLPRTEKQLEAARKQAYKMSRLPRTESQLRVSYRIGKKFGRQIGKKLGKKYGGDATVRSTLYEQLAMKKLNKWRIPFKYQYGLSVGKHKPGRYMLDFYLPKRKIALEIDGKSHDFYQVRERDARRDKNLLKHKIKTIRIRNKDVAKLTRKRLLRLIMKAEKRYT